MAQWSTKEELRHLLSELVAIPSITGSEAEEQFPSHVAEKLRSLDYFQQHPEKLQLHATGDGRSVLTALVKNRADVKETVVLISHFDVVEVDCYGDLKSISFQLEALTQQMYQTKDRLPKDVQEDLRQGEWVFGRGCLDMKAGLAVQMSLLEQAAAGEFQGNVLLLTVPDEEVNSVGMRAAIPIVNDIAEAHGLSYQFVINSEPMQFPNRVSRSVELGSIGKVLPGFYCLGKETHVKEPHTGLNGNFMASQITCEMEVASAFSENGEKGVTPPPTNLIQQSIHRAYSVTTPYRAVTMFHLFLMEKTAEDHLEALVKTAKTAARKIEETYRESAKRHPIPEERGRDWEVNVMTYAELYAHACQTFGKERIEELIATTLAADEALDDREKTIHVVDALALKCQQLAPLIVVFFAPPYYPPITSLDDNCMKVVTDALMKGAKEQHHVEINFVNYHIGITDLSYVGHEKTKITSAFSEQMPVWDRTYSIPFEAMARFQAPVINIGPYGKDLHKWTERLETTYSFQTLPALLTTALHAIFDR
ncbi:M20/M25/M40 family metallo-hydrolase [Aureibacillus halotolerans]|uniref:Arginine utilization protein RocB n=1 Tax=Aureibacillus halotolerans TaxID=1508390 RepID=A0A4R6U8E7_9BACI|nr:M20/M25/M40 family metallo-hydrolase [Aureibacillus halotolerans]TDQ40885.1 arginine utilization protein RocB [Aureibacillus halotolerans]